MLNEIPRSCWTFDLGREHTTTNARSLARPRLDVEILGDEARRPLTPPRQVRCPNRPPGHKTKRKGSQRQHSGSQGDSVVGGPRHAASIAPLLPRPWPRLHRDYNSRPNSARDGERWEHLSRSRHILAKVDER